jgi:hypothetical protein
MGKQTEGKITITVSELKMEEQFQVLKNILKKELNIKIGN